MGAQKEPLGEQLVLPVDTLYLKCTPVHNRSYLHSTASADSQTGFPFKPWIMKQGCVHLEHSLRRCFSDCFFVLLVDTLFWPMVLEFGPRSRELIWMWLLCWWGPEWHILPGVKRQGTHLFVCRYLSKSVNLVFQFSYWPQILVPASTLGWFYHEQIRSNQFVWNKVYSSKMTACRITVV